MVEQAAAVKVTPAGTELYSRTEYVTQPGRGALLPLLEGKPMQPRVHLDRNEALRLAHHHHACLCIAMCM